MRLEFDTAQIADLASTTTDHQNQWDQIWNQVRAQLAGTVDDALDAYTGSSLDERSAAYHARTQSYTAALSAQAQATSTVGQIATETNAAMARAIAL